MIINIWRLQLKLHKKCLAFVGPDHYYLIVKYFSSRIRSTSKNVVEASARVNSTIQESLSGIDVVKSFSSEERETNKLSGNLHSYLKSSVKQSIFMNISSSSISLYTSLISVFILAYCGLGIINNNFTLGTYIAFSGYVSRLFAPVQQFTSIGFSIQPAIVSLHRLNELLRETTEDNDKSKLNRINKLQGFLEFKDVTFGYEKKRVLRRLSFRINPGEKISIIGDAGAGKSTIIKLILGYYKVKSGIILIDGNDLNSLHLSSLRDRIGIISQKIFLFNDTIRNNILYSKPEALESELNSAINQSGVSRFINDLENRFETIIGERGVKLSGGQIQMISIARTLLKDPDLLILDEATSNIDLDTEEVIYNSMRKTFKDKTCIIISHRLPSISFVDNCLLLENGRIIKEGSYKEICNKHYQN